MIPSGSGSIKKDNVSTEEVVSIINQEREEQQLMRKEYKFFEPLPDVPGITSETYECHLKDKVSPKIEELKQIFKEVGYEQKWERIVNVSLTKVTDEWGNCKEVPELRCLRVQRRISGMN